MLTFFKNLATLAVTFAAVLISPSYAQADNTAMSSIQFLDKTYHLAWESDPPTRYSQYSGAIYLPEGETLSYYTHALSVDQEVGVSSITDAVNYFLEITRPEVMNTDNNIVNRIENLNTGTALLLFAFNERNEGREIITESNGRKILDLIEKPDAGNVFLVLVFKEHDQERDEIVWDWLVYRYSPMQTADGKQGVRRFGHTKRHHGSDGVSNFLKAIDVGNPQSEIINAVIAAKIL